MGETQYEIIAKPGHKSDDSEMMVMLQALLAERFQLQVHRETQMLSGYRLTVAKGGVKATVSAPGDNDSTNRSRGSLQAKGMPMSRLASKLSDILGVPVADATSDNRRFDFSLQWVPDDMQARSNSSAPVPDGPSLFTALQEQLGLRLESTKTPVSVLMVDRAESPSEN